MKGLRVVLGLGLLGMLCSCSSDANSSNVIAILPQLMQGEWLRDQESSDGGQTFADRTDNYRLTFTSATAWTDNRGRSGSWFLNRDLVTLVRSGVANLDAQVKMISGTRRMELTYYTDDSFATKTGTVQRYTKLSP